MPDRRPSVPGLCEVAMATWTPINEDIVQRPFRKPLFTLTPFGSLWPSVHVAIGRVGVLGAPDEADWHVSWIRLDANCRVPRDKFPFTHTVAPATRYESLSVERQRTIGKGRSTVSLWLFLEGYVDVSLINIPRPAPLAGALVTVTSLLCSNTGKCLEVKWNIVAENFYSPHDEIERSHLSTKIRLTWYMDDGSPQQPSPPLPMGCLEVRRDDMQSGHLHKFENVRDLGDTLVNTAELPLIYCVHGDDTYNDRTRQLTIKLGDKFGGRSVQLERMTGLIVTPLSH
ncbi:hypothetical protein BC629DRAFT_1438280 [Irpex lacteus]|nr:hypothetical protein BC629DRAFT_1438280 [Irpex lacteus]